MKTATELPEVPHHWVALGGDPSLEHITLSALAVQSSWFCGPTGRRKSRNGYKNIHGHFAQFGAPERTTDDTIAGNREIINQRREEEEMEGTTTNGAKDCDKRRIRTKPGNTSAPRTIRFQEWRSPKERTASSPSCQKEIVQIHGNRSDGMNCTENLFHREGGNSVTAAKRRPSSQLWESQLDDRTQTEGNASATFDGQRKVLNHLPGSRKSGEMDWKPNGSETTTEDKTKEIAKCSSATAPASSSLDLCKIYGDSCFCENCFDLAQWKVDEILPEKDNCSDRNVGEQQDLCVCPGIHHHASPKPMVEYTGDFHRLVDTCGRFHVFFGESFGNSEVSVRYPQRCYCERCTTWEDIAPEHTHPETVFGESNRNGKHDGGSFEFGTRFEFELELELELELGFDPDRTHDELDTVALENAHKAPNLGVPSPFAFAPRSLLFPEL